jgi:hypothetical protein
VSRSWLDKTFGIATIRLGRDSVSITSKKHARDSKANGAAVFVENDVADAEIPAWSGSIGALRSLLEQQANPGLPRRIKIVVSNEFVRYVLAPWTTEKLNETERVELVRALLSDRYGEHDSLWHIVIEAQRFEAPSLAAAIDVNLVKAIQVLCTQMHCRLVSITPALVESLNAQRHQFGRKKPGWYVNAGDGRLILLAFSRGEWLSVCNERIDAMAMAAETLLPLLRRDAICSPDLLSGTVYLPDVFMPAQSVSQCWPVVGLDDSSLQACT